MSYTFGLTIESLVAILLLLTIVYCARLNSRLERLRASESTMKTSVAELRVATEAAERAIAGLKATVRDARESLEPRLREAEGYTKAIADSLQAGEQVLARFGRIAAARELLAGAADEAPKIESIERAPAHDTQSMVAAAKAFAERARSRAKGLAA